MRRSILALLIAIGLGGCVVVPAEHEYHERSYYSYPRWGGGYYYYDDAPRHRGHRHWRERNRGWDRD